MDYREALEYLDSHTTARAFPLEVKMLCSEALVRQLPKKPEKVVHKKDGEIDYYCPTCEASLNPKHQNHHCICGQRLDWDKF